LSILDLDEIFEVKKPIIGVIHLKPLPGSPSYKGEEIEEILRYAEIDAKNLEDGGVNGVIVENFWDSPFLKRVRNPLTIATMSIIVKEIVNLLSVPVGVNLLRNSAIEAAAIAHICKGKFIRVNVYSESIATDSGIIEPAAPKLLRFISNYNLTLGILADIKVKHGAPIGERPIIDVALDTLKRGKASAVIVTGSGTGKPPKIDLLKKLKEEGITPVLIGSGLNPKNKELLKYADGAIVGTYFKKDGVISNPVDVKRVKELISAVKEYRK